VVDDQSNLWIGSDGSGLSFLDRQSNSWTHLRAPKLVSDKVIGVMRDQNGHILTSYFPEGLTRIVLGSLEVEKMGISSHGFIRKIIQRENGEYWVHGAMGVSPLYRTVQQQDFVYGWNIFLDARDQLWVASEDQGVHVVRRNSDKREKRLDLAAFNIYVDENEIAGLSTSHDGLVSYDLTTDFIRYFMDSTIQAVMNSGLWQTIRTMRGSISGRTT